MTEGYTGADLASVANAAVIGLEIKKYVKERGKEADETSAGLSSRCRTSRRQSRSSSARSPGTSSEPGATGRVRTSQRTSSPSAASLSASSFTFGEYGRRLGGVGPAHFLDVGDEPADLVHHLVHRGLLPEGPKDHSISSFAFSVSSYLPSSLFRISPSFVICSRRG